VRMPDARVVIIVAAGAATCMIFGLVLGMMLHPEGRLNWIFASLLAILLGIALVAGGLALNRQSRSLRKTQQEILETTLTLAAETSAASTRLVSALERIGEQVIASQKELGRQIGFQVEYQLVRDLNKRQTIEGDIVIRAILGAKSEILILDHLSRSGKRPDSSIRPDLMEAHLRLLADHVRKGGPMLSYKRLCQVGDVTTPFRGVADQAFVDHCREMYQIRQDVGARVTLRVTRRRCPYKFMIIDHRVMILSLHSLTPDDEPESWCEILITDPQQDLVRIFLEIWDTMDADAVTRNVSQEEIEGEEAGQIVRLD
jgi:hypothetical protein